MRDLCTLFFHRGKLLFIAVRGMSGDLMLSFLEVCFKICRKKEEYSSLSSLKTVVLAFPAIDELIA